MSLNVSNLTCNLSGDFSLKDITFSLNKGEILTLIGKSGSGKSSLLRCLAGLQSFKAQQFSIPKPLGMVFQSANLFSHLDLQSNIKLALIKTQSKTAEEAQAICDAVLEQVQLKHRANAYPNQMSGGEQQRGAIARALALKPEIILYDEPTSALDPELVDEVFEIMKKLKNQGITQVIVSHETRVVNKVSDKIGYFRGGALKWYGTPVELKTQINSMEKDEAAYLQLFI